MTVEQSLSEPCRFAVYGCPYEAVVKIELSDGCACFPEDHEQALCAQHLCNVSPRGSAKVLSA